MTYLNVIAHCVSWLQFNIYFNFCRFRTLAYTTLDKLSVVFFIFNITYVLVWSKSDQRRLRKTAQTNRQTDRQTNRHYENNGHLVVNQHFYAALLLLSEFIVEKSCKSIRVTFAEFSKSARTYISTWIAEFDATNTRHVRQHRRILRCRLQRQRRKHFSGPLLLRHLRLSRLLVQRSVLFQPIFRNELSDVQQHWRDVLCQLSLLLLLQRLRIPVCRTTVPHRKVL